jgi:hypothetical protein
MDFVDLMKNEKVAKVMIKQMPPELRLLANVSLKSKAFADEVVPAEMQQKVMDDLNALGSDLAAILNFVAPPEKREALTAFLKAKPAEYTVMKNQTYQGKRLAYAIFIEEPKRE